MLRLLQQGKLHGFKAGRDWRVKESELQRFEAQRGEVRHPTPPDPLAPVNEAIAKEGECTRATEEDQLHRETHGHEFTPPDIPE